MNTRWKGASTLAAACVGIPGLGALGASTFDRLEMRVWQEAQKETALGLLETAVAQKAPTRAVEVMKELQSETPGARLRVYGEGEPDEFGISRGLEILASSDSESNSTVSPELAARLNEAGGKTNPFFDGRKTGVFKCFALPLEAPRSLHWTYHPCSPAIP